MSSMDHGLIGQSFQNGVRCIYHLKRPIGPIGFFFLLLRLTKQKTNSHIIHLKRKSRALRYFSFDKIPEPTNTNIGTKVVCLVRYNCTGSGSRESCEKKEFDEKIGVKHSLSD